MGLNRVGTAGINGASTAKDVSEGIKDKDPGIVTATIGMLGLGGWVVGSAEGLSQMNDKANGIKNSPLTKALGKGSIIIGGATGIVKIGYKAYDGGSEAVYKDTSIGDVAAVAAMGLLMVSPPAAAAMAGASAAVGAYELVTGKDVTIESVVEYSKEAYNGIRDAVSRAIENGAEKVNNVMQKATDAYKAAEQKIADAYKNAEQAVKDGVKTAEKAVKEATQKAEQIAKELAKEVSDTFKEVSDDLADAFDKYRQAAEDAFNKWKQQAEDFFDDFKIPNPFDDLPDDLAEAFAKWAGINRSGFHYFYDPIVLDLDGDGIETIAYDKLKKAVFDHDGMVTTQRALFNHNNISILAINEEERWAA